MSTHALTCAEARELAPELAMNILGGVERAEAVLHVNGCARCQAVVSQLTEVADTLPQLVPEAAPPRGFEARVLRRIDAPERRTRRRWVAVVAAVAAAVAIVTITAIRVIESVDRSAAPVSVVMQGGANDAPAGWAYVSDGHGVAIAVDYGIASGAYTVRVVPAHGDPTSIGTIKVGSGRGSWTGRSDARLLAGSWIALVDRDGNEVCHGRVSSAG
jgi:hypothetical protein